MTPDFLTKKEQEFTLPTRSSTIGHWRFRGDLTDLSSKSNDLTGVNLQASHYENGYTESGATSLHLTGTEYAKIAAAEATDFDMGTDDFSIEVILRLTDVGSLYFVNKTDWSAPNTGYRLFTNPEGKVKIRIGDDTTFVDGASFASIAGGLWHYIVLTVDRSGDQARLYIDGTEDTNSPFDINSITGSISVAGKDFEVGYWVKGHLDEVCISKEVLSAAVIAEHAAGRFILEHDHKPNFLSRFLPSLHQGNSELRELLVPFDRIYQGIRRQTGDITNLLRWDRCPERFLTHLASMFGFELIDASFATRVERRNFLKWIVWIYRRKGTLAAVQKIIELLGFGGTLTESYPDEVPFVVGLHRLWDKDRIATVEFADDFSGNLSKWDAPVSLGSHWRLVSDRLYGTGDGTDDNAYGNISCDNAILFDCDQQVFYLEVDYEITENPYEDFGIVLKYIDDDNWLRLGTHTAGGTWLVFHWKVAGVEDYEAVTNITNVGVEILTGSHKFWIFADHPNNKYTFGFDNETVGYKESVSSAVAGLPAGKKGLLANDEITVAFDNLRLQTINRALSAVLHGDGDTSRKLLIYLTGNPAFAKAKEFYLQRVLPRYVPFGVVLSWMIKPSATGFGLGVNTLVENVNIKIGDILSGSRATSFALGTGNITVVHGSITLTPEPVAFALGTIFPEIVVVPDAIGFGLGTSDIKIHGRIKVNASHWKGNEEDPTNAFIHYRGAVWYDGDIDTPYGEPGEGDNWAAGVRRAYLSGTNDLKFIVIYDDASGDPDGFYTTNNQDEITIYGSTDNGASYSYLKHFDTPTRINRRTVLDISDKTTYDKTHYKIKANNGVLKTPNETILKLTEIELLSFMSE